MSSDTFHRVIKLDRLPTAPVVLEADAAERAAIARRFGLPAVHELRGTVKLLATGDAVEARGRVTARFDQLCAIANEPFANTLDEALAIRFVRALSPAPEDEEIELASEDFDEVEYDGAALDLGEAVAESFGLAIDRYATGPDAEAVRSAAGIADEDAPTGPFAALAALKAKS